MEYMNEQKEANLLKIMKWPPQSVDLVPIELLRDEFDRRLRFVGSTRTALEYALPRTGQYSRRHTKQISWKNAVIYLNFSKSNR